MKKYETLQKNVTWKLVPLPHGKKTIGCRWNYTVKLKADGSIEIYKARLAAKWNAVDRILRHLKSASGKGLVFSKNGDLEVVGYTDVDWAGSITNRRFTFFYFTFVEGNLITWQGKKKEKKVVSRSSTEAEYRGMAQGVCELLWIRRLLTELGFKPEKPMELHRDNKSAIDIAYNPVQHD
ncbi:hypothetical protein L3X38_019183 [Prunus dulcis]|uniref:Uncharacterized protein n=1 Tax=Prunus dulcis TaxID=3755 RepID=A0AAD4ZBF9_PRUDU|nr:hypothetical protein L3X38_019183 [Prunus dulcis]